MPRTRQADDFYFEGFDSPNTTPVPDVVFDRLLARLGEAELKALLYIIRRTFGFKRDRDPISFNQFLRGITTRDGRVLDEGCGIRDRTSLSKALKSLEEKGIVVSDKGVDQQGENITTVYALRFKGTAEEVVGNPYHRSSVCPRHGANRRMARRASDAPGLGQATYRSRPGASGIDFVVVGICGICRHSLPHGGSRRSSAGDACRAAAGLAPAPDPRASARISDDPLRARRQSDIPCGANWCVWHQVCTDEDAR